MKKKIMFLIMMVTVFVSLYLINILHSINVIPNKFFLIILGVYVLGNLINTLCLLSKKVILNILGVIISIIIIGVSIVGIKYGNNIVSLFKKTFNNNIEVNEYSVIVLKNSKYNELKDIDGKLIGYISLDNNKEDVIKTLKNSININEKEYNDVDGLYDSLLNKEIDSIVLNEGFLQILEDNYEDNDDNIKIIYNFEINKELNNNNEKVDELKPINVLISGSDSRSGQILALTRSDVNMIMTIDPKNHKILLTSIPRDYYVQLHGTSGLKDKLTHAGIYGIDMSKETLEDVFNIKIDYTVKVGFNSVIQIVDLIGGIDVESDTSFKSKGVGCNGETVYISKGMNHFNGCEALTYSRQRYAYIEGDNHRVQNQQQVLEAIINKIASDKSILLKADQLLESFSDLYRTDIPNEYVSLVIKEQLSNMNKWTIERQQVKGEGAMLETYSMPGRKLWVMIPDYNSVDQARNKIISIKSED